ncbi:MAG: gliding motility protein GldL [Bacteroidetes bacterium]|nr:gliding motility protein GldL [Bacteroidota bacterium]
MKFVHTKTFKNLMAKLYGWGASVVILGALFKINHYPGAEIMLIVGLGVEALIFFMSGFEPPHDEPDWTLVYPELAGIEDSSGGERVTTQNIQNVTISTNLDKMLEEANIGPELIEDLSKGLRNLSDNAKKLADISNATIATNQYVQNMQLASQSVLELSQSYKNTAEYLKHDLSLSEEYAKSLQNTVVALGEMKEAYQGTAVIAKENLQASVDYNESIKNLTVYSSQMAENYSKTASLLTQAVEAMEGSSSGAKVYAEQMSKTTQNLTALNAVYELQLQASNEQYANTDRLKASLDQFVANISESSANTEQLKTELMQLSGNIRALNNVYGNMLSAMSVGKVNG